jgi:hypothetical protein
MISEKIFQNNYRSINDKKLNKLSSLPILMKLTGLETLTKCLKMAPKFFADIR